MPMVEATYDHLYVTPRVMENFLEALETKLREALNKIRPKIVNFEIYSEARAQSPIRRNLPPIDVKIFYHAGWGFKEHDLEEILKYLEPVCAATAKDARLKEGSVKARMYLRDGHASITI